MLPSRVQCTSKNYSVNIIKIVKDKKIAFLNEESIKNIEMISKTFV